mmetsp:Transcript_101614/g.264977  ORF Transcript_101614/g.264977 Transcript_101614/m.264977 type:complete len:202 (+) Transcript_101614:1057-1662(+)
MDTSLQIWLVACSRGEATKLVTVFIDLPLQLYSTLGPLGFSRSSGEVSALVTKGCSGSSSAILALAARQSLWFSRIASETCCGARPVAGSLKVNGTGGTDGAMALLTASSALCTTVPCEAEKLDAGRAATTQGLTLAGGVARGAASPAPRGTAGGGTAPPMRAPRPSSGGTGGDVTLARKLPPSRGASAVWAMGGRSAHCG